MRSVVRLTSVALTPLLKHLLVLKNERWMNVHEVVVRLPVSKRVPLGCLHEILKRRRAVYLIQLVSCRWNVVIVEVRHEEQIFSSSSR
jgi:hypothetical protein